MARSKKAKPKTTVDGPVTDYRHTKAKRKNIPPAGLAAQGKIAEKPAERYFYNPHLSPILRFDATGKEDSCPELLETARQRALTGDEVAALGDALRNQSLSDGPRRRVGPNDGAPRHSHRQRAVRGCGR